MTFKTCITKKRKVAGGIDGLTKHLSNMALNQVEAGFFKEQGEYPSDRNTEHWSYAELMAFHELHENPQGLPHMPPKRPIFKIASKNLRKSLSSKLKQSLTKSLKSSVNGFENVIDPFFNSCGRFLANNIRSVFGKAPPLRPNTPATIKRKGGKTTPMIETGKLRASVKYKIKKDGVLRK